MATTVTRGKPKLYAKIFWLESKESDVIPLTSIRSKEKRVVGEECKLPWKAKTGKTSYHMQRVVAIDSSASYLESLVVDNNGKIAEAGSKALTTSMQQEKREMAAERRLEKSNTMKATTAIQNELLQCSSILSSNSSNNLKTNDSSSNTTTNEEVPVNKQISGETPQVPLPPLTCMPEVSYENIVFLENVLKLMKTIYQAQVKETYVPPANPTAVESWKTTGLGKVPLYEGATCHLASESLKKRMEQDATDYDPQTGTPIYRWKSLVRQVLIEYYGKQLANYCAVGRVNSKPGIDKLVYAELLTYATKFARCSISKEDYNKFINSTTWNKRPASCDTSVAKKTKTDKTEIDVNTQVREADVINTVNRAYEVPSTSLCGESQNPTYTNLAPSGPQQLQAESLYCEDNFSGSYSSSTADPYAGFDSYSNVSHNTIPPPPHNLSQWMVQTQ